MHLWCCLVPQATLTLNMLRVSRRHPQISAYTVLEGVFDFNKTPLAPPGTKVVYLGILTALKAGISDQRWNTTDVTACLSTIQNPSESLIPSNYFPRKYQCHMQLQLMCPYKPLGKSSAFYSIRTLSRSPKWAPIKSTPSNKSPPYSKNRGLTKCPLPSHL